MTVSMRVEAYQASGSISADVQTGYSGLTTTMAVTGSLSDSGRMSIDIGQDYSITSSTFTPSAVRTLSGFTWAAYATSCVPSSNSNSTCSRGNVTFTFSRPIRNPVLHIADFGGRYEAGCIVSIKGTLKNAASTPSGATLSLLSGAIVVGTNSITGRSGAPNTNNLHSSGSVQITGTISSLSFAEDVTVYRNGGSPCNTGDAQSATERLHATFSYSEDYGDGNATYDGSAAASHVIGDLALGSGTVTAENASTLNSATSPVVSSPIASAAATSDTDNAISGTPTAASIGQSYSLTVPISGASQAGQVCGYIDMDNSGTYTTSAPNERACTSFAASATSVVLAWTAAQWPAGAVPVASTGLRLRAAYGSNPTGAASPTGPADSGEVEDYVVQLLSPLPPLAQSLTGSGTVDANQTFTPATSQGSIDVSRTCILGSGSSCGSSLNVPGEGTYTVNANGTITFDPDLGFTGPVTPINYRIEDTSGNQSTSTISPTIVAPPSVNDDSNSTAYNTPVATNVLSNDSSNTGTALAGSSVKLCGASQTPPNCTATSVAVSGEGTYSVNTTTGVVTFTPLSSFTGASAITYQATDNLGGVDSATLSVTVAQPAGMSASPATSTGALDTNQTVSLPASAGTGTSLDTSKTCIISGATCVRSLVVSGEGTYTVNANGTVTFDPLPSFTGVAAQQTYRVEDLTGQRLTSSLTMTVAGVPNVANDTSTGSYDTNQTITPLANDTAGTGTSLSAASVKLCTTSTSTGSCAGTTLNISGEGTYTVNSNGTVTFDPLPSFTGTATPVKYVVSDGLGQVGTGTMTSTVQAPPASTGVTDTSSGAMGAAQTKNLLTNDVVGAVGVTFDATSVKLCSSGQSPNTCSATSLTVAGEGAYSVNSSGVLTFTPCSGVNTPAGASCTGSFTGTATPVTYQVSTNTSQYASSTFTGTVIAPPTVVADTGTGNWDVNQSFRPLANDSAGSGTTLNTSPLGICANGTATHLCTGTSLTVANQGTYTLNAITGAVSFDPDPAFTGIATPIQYVAVDGLGQKTAATITPTVTPPSPPTATSQTKTVIPGGAATFTTLTGTGGLATTGGPAFTTAATCLLDTSVTPNTCGTSLTVAGEGTYSLNQSTGVVSFTASGSATSGVKTPVSYRVTDATGQTATSTITPIIPAPPTVANDSSVNEQNATQTVSVIANDTATAYTTLSASTLKLCPSNATSPYNSTNCNLSTLSISNEGTYTANSDGTISFVPCLSAGAGVCPANLKYSGVATPVRYVVADNLGQYGSAEYGPTVLPPPVAQASNDFGSAAFASAVSFAPLVNDSGGTTTGLVGYTSTGTATLDPTTVRLCSSGQSAPNCTATTISTSDGTYSVDTSTGAISFVPATNFTGTPSNPPTYQVCNVIGGTWLPMAPPASCGAAQVTATISAPVAPVASNDSLTGSWNTPLSINVLANDTKDAALSLVGSSVRLCGTSQTPPNCTLTSLTVADEGVYNVNTTTGVVSFTPYATFTDTASTSPRYQVTDSFGATTSATITPTVTPPPSPVANSESKAVLPGSTVTFTNVIGLSALASGTALQVGNGDGPCLVDPSDGLCKASITVSGEGVWTINRTTGVATFAADSGAATGSQTPVVYRVTDGAGQVASATLTATVPPTPTPVNDTSTGPYDTNQTTSVLGNDTSGTGTALVPSSVRLCTTATTNSLCVGTSLNVSGEGTYTANSDGSVTFDPLPSFSGSATPIKYVVQDNLGQIASGTLSSTVQNPAAPTAIAETRAALPSTTATFTTLTGSTGLVTGTLLVTGAVATGPCLVDPADSVCKSAVSVAGVGTWAFDQSSGIATFVVAPNAPAGSSSTVQYRVADAFGQVGTSTLTVVVPLAPVPAVDASTGSWKSTQNIAVLSNDRVDASVIADRGAVRLCGISPPQTAPSCTQTSLVVSGQGAYAVQTDGSVTFTPESTFVGTATPVTYVMADSVGQKASSTLTVTVTPPAAPSAMSQTKTLAPGESVTFTPLIGTSGLATAVAGAPALVSTTMCLVDPVTSLCRSGSVTISGRGTFALDERTGVVTFTAFADAPVGGTPSIAYRVSDELGRIVSATLAVTIEAGPKAVDDASRGQVGQKQSVSVTSNDERAADGSVLVPSSVRLCGPRDSAPVCTATSLTVPGEGRYIVGENGVVTFTPVEGFTGQASGVSYSVADTKGRKTSAKIAPFVVPPPAPIAQPDTATVAFGQKATVDPLANDRPGTPPSSEKKKISLVAQSVRLCAPGQSAPKCTARRLVTFEGTYVVTAAGLITFEPAKGFSGTATQPAQYQVANDWSGATGPGTSTSFFTPTILARKNPLAPIKTTTPAAVDHVNWTRPETPVYFRPTFGGKLGAGSKWNVEATRLLTSDAIGKIEVVTSEGTWTVIRDNVRFVPVPGFLGRATIEYVIVDSFGDPATANLTAVVMETPPVLPATGATRFLVQLSTMLLALGAVITASSRRRRLSQTRG